MLVSALLLSTLDRSVHQSCHKNKHAVLLFYKSTEGEVCSGISQSGMTFRATHCKALSKSAHGEASVIPTISTISLLSVQVPSCGDVPPCAPH